MIDTCTIHIYKNQANDKQLRYILRRILNVKDEKYILPSVIDDKFVISVTGNFAITLHSYNTDLREVMDNLIEDLKENLNAAKFCCVYKDETIWYEPTKFKMKFKNKIKHVINEWNKVR